MAWIYLTLDDGTAAIPAARLGTNVLGVHIARNLVAAGNNRANAEGHVNCKFLEERCHRLAGIDDESFDRMVSIFGAMFALSLLMWQRKWSGLPAAMAVL